MQAKNLKNLNMMIDEELTSRQIYEPSQTSEHRLIFKKSQLMDNFFSAFGFVP
jgi:hypothetical protein